jgi:thiamine kinase-like enzyme
MSASAENPSQQAAIERIQALPLWQSSIKLEPLKGGLSNMSFKADHAGKTYVVRVGDDFPFHHVFRDREALVSRWAHSAGLSPPVVFAQGGVLVCDFIDGHTYGPEDVRRDVERVVDLIRRCHSAMPTYATGPAILFWVFHVLRDYIRTLAANNHSIARELPRFASIADGLQSVQQPLPIIFGHHDLLPANFIADKDRLWLIDWEYGGFGTALFDLANVATNAGFSAAEEERLLELYFERPLTDDMRRSFAAMKVASALREALWALVSDLHLRSPGINYQGYAVECFSKFEEMVNKYEQVYDSK